MLKSTFLFSSIVNVNGCCIGWVIDVQYSNWEIGHPNLDHQCVIVVGNNRWNSLDCDTAQLFVCQS